MYFALRYGIIFLYYYYSYRDKCGLRRMDMKFKSRKTFLIAILILACCLIFASCADGDSPVQSIAVTSMPVTEYYRGDFFNLNNAVITVYYENGKVETVPVDASMISDFDSQQIGEQILTIKYEGQTAYIKVTVSNAPIYSLEVVDDAYKKTYVQGQTLDVKNMNLKIVYTNNFSEIIPITEDMVGNFDTSFSGERELVIFYGDKSATCLINVVAPSISQIGVEAPDKLDYIVGQTLDFTGSRLFVSYNNNTQRYLEASEFTASEDFKLLIDGEETDTFTRAGTIYVTFSYFGHTTDFLVTVQDVKATKLEIVSLPADQPRGSEAVDLSAGLLRVTYNNGEVKDFAMDDVAVSVNWREFDLGVNGSYDVDFTCEGLTISTVIRVVEPVEKEMFVDVGENVYYQDGPAIDVTEWTYKILLTNGRYRQFADGADYAYLSEDMLEGEYDLSTEEAGVRTFRFVYESADRNIVLHVEVEIEVLEKIPVGIGSFTAPTKNVFVQNDVLDLSGGFFTVEYNDGTFSSPVALTADMLKGSGYTSEIGRNITVELVYSDPVYGGSLEMSYTITVIRKAYSLSYDALSSVGLKLTYVKGETFDSANLVLRINYLNEGQGETVTDFSGAEWIFEGTCFAETGAKEVTVWYGDKADGIFAVIPVTVTNEITNVEFVKGFAGFGTVVEGVALTVPEGAALLVTRENGETETVPVTVALTDYDRNDLTLGERKVCVSYAGFTVETTVTVRGRIVTELNVLSGISKTEYLKTDQWDFTGLSFVLRYDNGTSVTVNDSSLAPQSDGTYLAYAGGRTIKIVPDALFNDFDDIYYRQDVRTVVSDVTVSGNEAEQEFTFTALIFEQLVSSIKILFKDGEGNLTAIQRAEVYESLDLSYEGMYAEITFEGGEKRELALNTLIGEFETFGYDKNKAGIQSVKFAYLGRECTFTVNVRAKVIESVSVTPDTVSVTEGMALPSENMEIVLHFLNADGAEYDEPYYLETELGNVVCSYDPNATFVFDKTEGGVGYTEQVHTVSYTLNGKTVEAEFTVKIYRKQATGLAMQNTPKQVYIEHETELLTDGGSVLVYYDNGTRATLGLESTRLRMDTSEFNTSELQSGAERQVKIYIYFVDDNGKEVSTYYNVTVKDRKYYEVVYDEETLVNNEYYFQYGSKEDLRPGFTVYGYIAFDGDRTALLTENDYDTDNKGFSLYYIDSTGNRSEEWPTQAGVYTLVIEHEGDAIHNPFVENSRQIRIYPKELAVFAEKKTVTYGDAYDSGELTYNWVLKGYSDTGLTYVEDPLEYEDNPENVLKAGFNITYGDGTAASFFEDTDGTTVINLNAGDYVLVPYLEEMLSQNYTIKEYISATLTVGKKDVTIVAKDATRTYGEADPRFGYTVYDSEGSLIGEDGVITLAGRLNENVPLYTLQRAAGDDENVGTHRICAGLEANLSNYNVLKFTEGELVIQPKTVSLDAAQSAERIYGKPGQATEYVFALSDGESLAYEETFEEIFALLSDYVTGITEGKVSMEIYSGDSLVYSDKILPLDAKAGIYTVKTTLTGGYASNYEVTVSDFDFEIKPMPVTVEIGSATVVYSEFADGEDLDGKSVYDGNYELSFGEGYALETEPLITLVKEKGISAGRYLIEVSSDTFDSNPDYEITVTGNYGTFFDSFDFGGFTPDYRPDETESSSAYLVILPYEFSLSYATEETYARKSVLYPDLTFDFGETSFAAEITDGLKQAISFSFENMDSNKAGYGYYTADDYRAVLDYDYFASEAGSNFLITGITGETGGNVDKKPVYEYCFGGQTVSSAVLFTTEFVYTVNPVELDIRSNNSDVSYNGSEIEVTFTDGHTSSICAGDSLTIGYAISVLYYGKDSFVSAEKVVEAGEYRIAITGIGNFNYELNQEAASYVHEFTVNTIVLDILIENASPLDENTDFISAVYNGRAQQPLDNDWSAVADPSEENGYFFTNTHRVVNATGLTSAPKSLRIEPYTLNASGETITPVNAGEYDLRWYVNADYTNYSVRFVKRNSSSEGALYVETSYKFIIEKKEVQLQNVASVASKTYDGKPPVIENASTILIIDAASADPVKYTDLVFTFERDIEKVPEKLRGLISADDMTSVGYFRMTVTSSKTQNYTFVLDTEYYVITRIPVAVTLNASGYSLAKQYDAEAPSAVLSDLRTNVSGGIKDEVYFDLDNKYYKSASNGSWTSYDPSANNVGYYAYDFRPYFMVNGTKVYSDEIGYADETTGNALLSWNYVYYIVKDNTLDANGCDGVYNITQKEISLTLPDGENKADGGIMYYMYGVPYANRAITVTEAAAAINELYTISDADGTIEEAELERLGFVRTALTIADASAITSAGSYFNVLQTDLENNNPNFRLVNNPVRYVIDQLEVTLTLTFTNNTDGRQGMIYGERVLTATKYDNIDFADPDAFRLAMGFAEDHVIDINDWISSSQADYGNNKFITNNAVYYLVMDDTSYDLRENTVLNAGVYTADVRGIIAQNFFFTIVGAEFEIEPKPITVSMAERDYFDKNSLQIAWAIDGNVNKTVEEVLINSVLSKFSDRTTVAADSGSYSQGDSKFGSYYIQALKEDIDKVTLDYPNYVLEISSVTPTDATEGMIYLPLSIKKLPVAVSITAPGGGRIELDYGHQLIPADYTIVYSGMPVLDSSSTDYDYEDEYLKQNEVKSSISGSMLDLTTLFAAIGSALSSDNPYTYDLNMYLKENADLTTDNFDLTFGEVVFKVNKIQINVRMVNNAGTTYNSDGNFSIIFSEIGDMTYSADGKSRLNYAFDIINRNSIIGYEEGDSLKKMLGLIFKGQNGTEADAEGYENQVRYVITTKSGTGAVVAGENYIALTDTWYQSTNYVIKCEPAVIMVYPKVQSIGNNNVLPYTAISLTGQEADFIGNIKNNLGMMVKVNYEGMPDGKETEWLDIRRAVSGDVYQGAYYARNWRVSFAGEEPVSLKVGDETELILSFSESFFNGDVTNAITSVKFKVRIYGTSDSLVKDKTTSDFIFGNASSSFSSYKDANGTYLLSEAKQSVSPYEGMFDILSADFVLEVKESSNYSAEFILYQNGSVTVKLGFRGGNDYGYYLIFEDGNEAHRQEIVLKEYEMTTDGDTVTRSVLEDVNVFDGRKHRLTAYLDKIGYIADDKVVNAPSERLYRVMFVLDDKYAYELTFVGGSRTLTVSDEGASVSVSSEDYVDFSSPSQTGFVINECKAYISRFSLKTMGVGVTGQGYVADYTFRGVTEGALYYLAKGESIESLFTPSAFNSNDGYDGKYTLNYVYYDAVSGKAVENIEEEGLYKVNVTLSVNGQSTISMNVYVLVVEYEYGQTYLTVNEEKVLPSYASPVTIDASESGTSGFSGMLSRINYSRIVFDFEDYSTDTINASLRFMLKSSDNFTVDLPSVTDPNYKGISVAVNRKGEVDGTPVYETVIYLASDGKVYVYTVDGVDWRGTQNILEATYDYANGVIYVSLRRGGAVIFSKKIYKNYDDSGTIGASNISAVIGGPDGSGGYTGVFAFRSVLKLYEVRSAAMGVTLPEWSDFEGNVVEQDGMSAGKYMLTDAYGTVQNVYGNSTQFVFSADGASSDSVIRLAFANNMPFFTQSAGSLFNGTMGRGAYIEIRNNDVQLNLYKNTVVYNPNMSGNITSVNLLDGNEHTMTIIVTEEETTITGTAVVAAYKVYVIIDGTTYTAAIPIANDLSEIYTTSGSSGIDPESVVDSADSIFLSSSRYVGIEVVGGLTFDLKGIYVF